MEMWRRVIVLVHGDDDDDRAGFLDFLATGGVEIYQPGFAMFRVRHQETPSLRYLGSQTR